MLMFPNTKDLFLPFKRDLEKMLFKRNINHKEYIFVQFLPIRGQCIVLMFWFLHFVLVLGGIWFHAFSFFKKIYKT